MKKILEAPIIVVIKAVSIAAASIIFTIIIPGIVAAGGNVFYESGMLTKLPSPKRAEIEHFRTLKADQLQQIALLDQQLSLPARDKLPPDAIMALATLRELLQKQTDNETPPVAVAPFYLNPQMLLWPAIYSCLAWIAFLLPPSNTEGITPRKALWWIGLGFGIYAFYEWPLWFRNFILTSEGRNLYAYPNYDIHPASFFTQEIVVLGFCLLLARIWQTWSDSLTSIKSKTSSEGPVEKALNGDMLDQLTAALNHWQVTSIILALGFTFFTRFFWEIADRFNDQRYFLTALLAHTLWGLTWILLSLPLAYRWHRWNRARHNALCELATSSVEKYPNRKEALDILKSLSPTSMVASLITGIAAFVSFTGPFLRHLVGQ